MKLLESQKIGNQILKNSMAMAPMTRSRANLNGVVSDLTVLYYTQRTSAGLIISEAIKQYVDWQQYKKMQKELSLIAKAKNIITEEDVNRIIHELR